METFKALFTRRSIRSFTQKAVVRDDVEKILDAGRFAPSARAVDPWHFIVVTEMATLSAIADITDHGKFIRTAAACIAVYCKETKYYLEDGCAATENMLIAATALGIASCWVAGDKKLYGEKIRLLLEVPAELKLVSIIALGYPEKKSEFKRKDKNPLYDIVHWGKF